MGDMNCSVLEEEESYTQIGSFPNFTVWFPSVGLAPSVTAGESVFRRVGARPVPGSPRLPHSEF